MSQWLSHGASVKEQWDDDEKRHSDIDSEGETSWERSN